MKAFFRAAVLAAALPSLALAQSTKHPTLVEPVAPGELGVAQGIMPYTSFLVWGVSLDCDSASEVVWALGSDYNWLQAADELRIVTGGDAADTSNGAGAREIVVEGLDASWDQISERIQTQGANVSVKTTQQFIRLNKAYVRISGTYSAANTGIIDIETEAGTQVGIIAAGQGTSSQAVYSVPDGYTAYVMSYGHNYDLTGDAAGVLQFALRVRKNADDTSVPVTAPLTPFLRQADPNFTTAQFSAPIVAPARSDIYATCLTGGNDVGSATFEVILVPDASAVNATPTPTPMPSPTQSPTPTPTP